MSSREGLSCLTFNAIFLHLSFDSNLKMTKCADESKKANIEKFKKYLMLARGGPIKAEVKVDHNNGKSCFLIEFEVTK